MAFVQRDMSGSLFRNDKRTDENNQPNAKGSALIGGEEYWVDGWTKLDKNGNKWQSLKFTPKDKDQKQHEPRKTGLEAAAEMDSDIPF